ncbi:BglG family transcription antiterminator [Metabacillus herbersteinensis]|uniref:BglG family transcription antiterminator n=1 Tax=Metabacillus herbersteinensis TaxID=283816 RepID=A0ABV6GGN8_9BACI
MLTARELEISKKLLNSKLPIRIKDLSVEFGVSTRTIKYDLENVRGWYKSQETNVISQTNKGIWIDCNDSERMELRNILTQSESTNIYPNQTVRGRRIVMLLLLTNNYVTASDLAVDLNVSRNTILSDLNLVDEFLESWAIKLERKHRTGYRLIGNELQLRFMLEHIIYNDLDDYEIYKMTTRITKGETNFEPGTVLNEPLKRVYRIVENCMSDLFEPSLTQRLRLSDLLKIQLRLTFSVTRLNLGHTIGSYRVLDQNQHTDQVSLFVFSVMEKIHSDMQLPLLEEEYLYISGGMDLETGHMDLIDITEKMINYVGELECLDYQKDPKLFSNLLAHLSLRFQNGTLYLNEMNPIANEIKRNHGELFRNVQDACRKFIKQHAFITQDSFISYIVLHFLVSYENTFKKKTKVKVLYVCSTGRGVARLIKNRVEKEIPTIEIVAYCSLLEVEDICQHKEVDLIVSVFPVETSIPVVVVEALPTKSDIEELRDMVKLLIGIEAPVSNQLLEGSELNLVSEDSETISQEIILKGFEVIHDLLEVFPLATKENWKNAFMMHVFLMVHRYHFDKQYDQYLYTTYQIEENDEEIINKVQSILKDKDMHVHEAEIITLLQYFKKWK